MFIKLTAAFSSEEQPDYEGMGIVPKADDFEDVEWLDFYVQDDCIVSMNVNDIGDTNIILITGETWRVKETPVQIVELCQSANSKYSI